MTQMREAFTHRAAAGGQQFNRGRIRIVRVAEFRYAHT